MFDISKLTNPLELQPWEGVGQVQGVLVYIPENSYLRRKLNKEHRANESKTDHLLYKN